ncbi:MAG: nucleoside-diphosphate kinase [Nitrospinota bacterium]
MERTLCIIKPDAMERGLAGKILTRLEREGFPRQKVSFR